MKNTLKSISMILVILLVITKSGVAQEEGNPTRVSVELDPATFVFKGYGVHLRIQPKNKKHLFLGVGAYAMDMPALMVDMNKENKAENWEVRINQGYGVFAEHHFTEVNKKWFVGMQASLQEYKISKENVSTRSKYWNGLAMAYVGYTFKPFGEQLYIKPWTGIGYTTKVDGDNRVEGAEYVIAPVTVFATLHIGYTF